MLVYIFYSIQLQQKPRQQIHLICSNSMNFTKPPRFNLVLILDVLINHPPQSKMLHFIYKKDINQMAQQTNKALSSNKSFTKIRIMNEEWKYHLRPVLPPKKVPSSQLSHCNSRKEHWAAGEVSSSELDAISIHHHYHQPFKIHHWA